jgi:hypothetical protein
VRKDKALTIDQGFIGHEPAGHLVRGTRSSLRNRAPISKPAVVVARSVAMVALAAFAILVLLPAAVGAAV